MISIKTSGSTAKADKFLDEMSRPKSVDGKIRALADAGVRALQQATPQDSGKTAAEWGYEIEVKRGEIIIHWTNSNIVGGTAVAVLLQLGHGTGTGGYVQGRDFINPALQPIFDQIADAAWKVVTSA